MTQDSDSIIKGFGAEVNISLPDQTLYLVMGYDQSLYALITHFNGQILFDVPNHPVVLALLPITAYFTLKVDSRIKHIGPVSIDSGTFNKFLELLKQQ
ncbi:MAG: hypothetical protein WBC91_03360 [Phototrophicaceae bacterium]